MAEAKLTKSEIDALDRLIANAQAGRPFNEPVAGRVAELAEQVRREVARQEMADFARVWAGRPVSDRGFTPEEERILLERFQDALLKEPTLDDLVEFRRSVRSEE